MQEVSPASGSASTCFFNKIYRINSLGDFLVFCCSCYLFICSFSLFVRLFVVAVFIKKHARDQDLILLPPPPPPLLPPPSPPPPPSPFSTLRVTQCVKQHSREFPEQMGNSRCHRQKTELAQVFSALVKLTVVLPPVITFGSFDKMLCEAIF